MMNKLHGIIFAYLSNPDLRELTQHRNTCSIPYGGRYRVIDFMLSNMVNAGVSDVGLIVHANYQSLLDHVGSGKDWDLSRKHGGLRILPPFGYSGRRRASTGAHDALAGVRSYLQYIRQDYVVLAGGDLAVNLPLNDIFEAHIRNDADITAVCTSRPMGSPKDCDYFTIGAGGRITDVLVHPPIAQGCESLEVYILSKQLLLSLVDHCAAHNIPSFSTACSRPWPASSRFAHTSLTAMPPASSPWLVTSPAAWSCLTPRCGPTSLPPAALSAPRIAPTRPPTTAQAPGRSTPWWLTAASLRARWRTPSSSVASVWRRGPRSRDAC